MQITMVAEGDSKLPSVSPDMPAADIESVNRKWLKAVSQIRLKQERDLQTLQAENAVLRERLQQCVKELAELTRLVLRYEDQVDGGNYHKQHEKEGVNLLSALRAVLNTANLPKVPVVSNLGVWRRLNMRRQLEVLNRTRIFDPEWYLKKYPDVANASIDPAIHFIRYGLNEGRIPCALFDIGD